MTAASKAKLPSAVISGKSSILYVMYIPYDMNAYINACVSVPAISSIISILFPLLYYFPHSVAADATSAGIVIPKRSAALLFT